MRMPNAYNFELLNEIAVLKYPTMFLAWSMS